MTVGRISVVGLLLSPVAVAYWLAGGAVACTVAAFTIPAIMTLAKRW